MTEPWIYPHDGKLPEEGDTVLVWSDVEGVNYSLATFKKGKFCFIHINGAFMKVIAWQPLNEPAQLSTKRKLVLGEDNIDKYY